MRRAPASPSHSPRLHKLKNLHDWNGDPWKKLAAWSPPAAKLSYSGERLVGASCVTARRTCIWFFMPLSLTRFFLVCCVLISPTTLTVQPFIDASSCFLFVSFRLRFGFVGDNKEYSWLSVRRFLAVFIYCKDLLGL